MLPVNDPVRDTGEFRRIQARLREMPRARSMNEAARRGGNNSSGTRYPDDRDSRYPDDNSRLDPRRVEYPSARFRAYTEGNLFRISVPENWREMNNGNEVTFAPEGAYGSVQGQFVFTHGVQVGTARAQSNNLQAATENYIKALAYSNPNIRQEGNYQRTNFGNRNGLGITLSNISEATGRREVVSVMTTLLRNGDLLYVIFVVPQDEYTRYQNVFGQIARNIEIGN